MSALRERLAVLLGVPGQPRQSTVRVDDSSRIDQRKQEMESKERAISRRRALKYGAGVAATAGAGWLVYDQVTTEGPAEATRAYYEGLAEGDSDTTSEYTHSDAPRQSLPGFLLSRLDGSDLTVDSVETAEQGDGEASVEVTLDIGDRTRSGTVECRTDNGNWRLWAGQEQPLLPPHEAVVFRYYDELDRGNKEAALATIHEDAPVSDLPDAVARAYEKNDLQIVGLETIEDGSDQRLVEIVIVGATSAQDQQTVTVEARTQDGEWKVWFE